MNRADRRRAAKARAKYAHWPPRQLSMINGRPDFDPAAARAVMTVKVDGVVVEQCVQYDMDVGFARPKHGAVRNGVVTVTLK